MLAVLACSPSKVRFLHHVPLPSFFSVAPGCFDVLTLFVPPVLLVGLV